MRRIHGSRARRGERDGGRSAVAIAVPAIGANGNDKDLTQARARAHRRGEGRRQDLGHGPRRGEGRRGERRDPRSSKGSGQRSSTAMRRSAISARASPLDKVEQAAQLSERRGARRGRDRRNARPAPEGVGGPSSPQTAARRRRHRASTRTCRRSDTGAAQFVDANPTWDGRGVTIGIVDTRRLARPSEPADDEHRRAQDRRLGDGHRSVHRQRPDLDQHGRPRSAARRSSSRASPTRRPPPARTASVSSTSATRASAVRSATTSTATATRPARVGSSPSSGTPSTNDVWVDTNQNNSFADELAMTRLQGALRRRLLRHRQPGDAVARAHAVRRPDRRQEQGRQHRHRLRPARLARGGHRRRQRAVRRRR